MVRIVWGVLLILGGLGLVGNSFAEYAISQQLRIGKADALSSFFAVVLGLASCILGSIMIYFGDDARLRRLENPRQSPLSDNPPNYDPPFEPPSPLPKKIVKITKISEN